MSALGIRAMLEGWIKIPDKFYYDHMHRGLPTPEIAHQTKAYTWIKKDDPALGELIDDARYYANQDGPDIYKAEAKALLKALASQGVEV